MVKELSVSREYTTEAEWLEDIWFQEKKKKILSKI